jgi:hypothetical protein
MDGIVGPDLRYTDRARDLIFKIVVVRAAWWSLGVEVGAGVHEDLGISGLPIASWYWA